MVHVTVGVVHFSVEDLNVAAGASSVTGNVRRVNEDSVLVRPGLYAVADGMGGHNAGDVASRLTIEAIEELLDETGGDVSALASLVQSANDRVRTHAVGAGLEGMGSTLVCAVVVTNGDEHSVVVVNVGDSRCYLLADDGLFQLTKDHSHVQDLVDRGVISRSEAATHPERNVVTRAIGVEDAVVGDFYMVPAEQRLRILLCSDGVSGEITDQEIERVLQSSPNPAETAERLTARVLEGPARDNASAVVIDVVRSLAPTPTSESRDTDVTGPRRRPLNPWVAPADPVGDVPSLIATVPLMTDRILTDPVVTAPAEQPLISEVPRGLSD